MSVRHDVLDEREALRKPLLTSLVLHGGVVAALLLTGVIDRSTVQWGDPQSLGGGSVGITPVKRIPLPGRDAPLNPVSNDTESQIPQQPREKPQPRTPPKPDPDAIAIKGKPKPRNQSDVIASNQRYQSRPSDVYSSTGAAASSPIYSQSGGGGVGSSMQSSPFGYGFAWYEQLIREKVARNWKTEELDARLQTAPPVVVFFEIHRDGSVRNVRIAQSSNNFALDQSAQRAIIQSAPFQPLPAQFQRDIAPIEFWFRLKR